MKTIANMAFTTRMDYHFSLYAPAYYAVSPSGAQVDVLTAAARHATVSPDYSRLALNHYVTKSAQARAVHVAACSACCDGISRCPGPRTRLTPLPAVP